jgi:hypothetical protein
MATFSLSSFAFTPKSDSVTHTEIGSNLVTAISNSALVNALKGNDSIFGSGSGIGTTPDSVDVFGINNFKSGIIVMDAGNDSISGVATADTNQGDFGSHVLSIGVYNQGQIVMGAGHDSISGVATANGNSIVSSIYSRGIVNEGKIDAGAGNDKMNGTSTSKDSGGIVNSGQIDMGTGNDSISGTNTSYGGSFSLDSSGGDGISNRGQIDMGLGNDSITGTSTSNAEDRGSSTGIYNSGRIDMGTGNDSILGTATGLTATGFSSASGIDNTSGIIDMGAGNDSIRGTSTGAFGYGINNTGGRIDMGVGNDSITSTANGGGDLNTADGINNTGGIINMDAGNDSMVSTVTRGSYDTYGLYNGKGGKIDAGTGNDNLFFAVNIYEVSKKVTIDGGGDIFMGLGNDSFTGFGNMTVYGDAGTGNTSKKDILDLSLFNSSEFTIEKIGTGANHAKFTYNDPTSPGLPSVIMTTNEFDKFIFADKTVNYALLA